MGHGLVTSAAASRQRQQQGRRKKRSRRGSISAVGPYLRYDDHCTVLVVTKYGPRSIFQHVWNSGIGSVGEILFVSVGSRRV